MEILAARYIHKAVNDGPAATAISTLLKKLHKVDGNCGFLKFSL